MTYRVMIPFLIWAAVDVEADNEHEAIDKALNDTALTTYCGNGGDSKLAGTYCHADLEVGDYFEDKNAGIMATAELIE